MPQTDVRTEAAARLLEAGAGEMSPGADPGASPPPGNLGGDSPATCRSPSGSSVAVSTPRDSGRATPNLKSALRSLRRRRRTQSAGPTRRMHWGEGPTLELSVRRGSSIASDNSINSENQRTDSPWNPRPAVNWASPRSINVLVPITPPSHPQRRGQYGSLIGRRRKDQGDDSDPSGCTDLPIERDPETEPMLGALWYADSTVLREVRSGGPLDKAGGSELIGRKVIRVNGCRVDTAEEVTAAAAGRDCVVFRFRPLTRRILFQRGEDIDFLWEGYWRRGKVREVVAGELQYKLAIPDGQGGVREFVISFDAAQVALRSVLPRVRNEDTVPEEVPDKEEQPGSWIQERLRRFVLRYSCCWGDKGRPTELVD